MIEIEGPDGVIYEFPEGTSEDTMRTALMQVYGQPQQPSQGPGVFDYVAQAGAGSQEGIAQMLGFPVDAVNSAIGGVGELTGLWETPQRPFLGSEMINDWMQPIRADIPEPSTPGLRVARRVGEEVGASAVGAPLAIASAPARPLAAAGVEAASALGSGTGAAVANEIAPDSAAAEIIGALVGGVPAGMAASRALGMNGTDAVMRGGIEEQRAIADDAYGMVRADQRTLPADSTFNLGLDIDHRMAQERINPRLQPGASAVRDAIVDDVMQPMRIEDMENLRRLTQQGLSATASPADQRLAGIMRDQITEYLDNIGDPVADALVDGRNAHRRASAAQTVADASTRAARRAASTGSGGNEINAMRQNLRGILDNPRRARSFTAAEREMMEQIVTGNVPQNMMRRLSRFAPSSGGLSMMLNLGGVAMNPAAGLAMSAITEGARGLGERETRRVIDALMQSIAPDRVLQVGETGINPVIQALLAGRTVSGAGE